MRAPVIVVCCLAMGGFVTEAGATPPWAKDAKVGSFYDGATLYACAVDSVDHTIGCVLNGGGGFGAWTTHDVQTDLFPQRSLSIHPGTGIYLGKNVDGRVHAFLVALDDVSGRDVVAEYYFEAGALIFLRVYDVQDYLNCKNRNITRLGNRLGVTIDNRNPQKVWIFAVVPSSSGAGHRGDLVAFTSAAGPVLDCDDISHNRTFVTYDQTFTPIAATAGLIYNGNPVVAVRASDTRRLTVVYRDGFLSWQSMQSAAVNGNNTVGNGVAITPQGIDSTGHKAEWFTVADTGGNLFETRFVHNGGDSLDAWLNHGVISGGTGVQSSTDSISTGWYHASTVTARSVYVRGTDNAGYALDLANEDGSLVGFGWDAFTLATTPGWDIVNNKFYGQQSTVTYPTTTTTEQTFAICDTLVIKSELCRVSRNVPGSGYGWAYNP